MDSLKSLPQITIPVRAQVGTGSPAPTGSDAPAADVFEPTQTPVQIFLTPQQAMALCQPEPGTHLPEAPAQPRSEKSTNDRLKEAVPGPIKMLVDGIPLPGMDAKIKPRFDNGGVKGGPTGIDFKLKW